MYNSGMFWFTLICLILLTAVFIYQMKLRLYGGTSVFHKLWCLIRGAYYKITSVAGYGITKLQSKSSREPEEEFLKCPMEGELSGKRRNAQQCHSEKMRADSKGEYQHKQYKMKVLR